MSYSISSCKPWVSAEIKRDAFEGAAIGVMQGHVLSGFFAAAHLDSGVTGRKLDRVINLAVASTVVCVIIGVSLSVISGLIGRRLK